MNLLIEQLMRWLKPGKTPTAQTIAQERERKDPVQQRLPPAIAEPLNAELLALPMPESFRTQVTDQLRESLKRWRANPDSSNCLVMLGHPVEPLALWLKEVATHLDEANLQIMQLQQEWSARPHNYSEIKSLLAEEFKQRTQQMESESRSDGRSPQENPLSLVVIPSLDWCFLRCLDGLTAIEYLRSVVLNDRSRFWLMACNHWGWEYLDQVCQLSAYFGQTVSLPDLNALQLRNWLLPVMEDWGIAFLPDLRSKPEAMTGLSTDTESSVGQISGDRASPWNSIEERRYFEILETLSNGVSSVALSLWLNSLCYAPPDQTPPDSASAVPERLSQQGWIYRSKAKLPKIPNFSADERYALYSLLLHGGISLSHLASSLGDEEGDARVNAQVLQRAGIVERDRNLLWVKPTCYPGIREDLYRNNFLVHEES